MKRIVIVGATSTIAQHCARLWAADGAEELILIGRNQARLETTTRDLRIRHPSTNTRIIECDFLKPEAIQNVANNIFTNGPIDIALIAHGILPDQKACQSDLQLLRESLEINAVSVSMFSEAFATNMEKVNYGKLAIIGSVAGDRGRKTNYIYGAAKGLIDRYAQGLQHRLARTSVRVILIKPGPTRTAMTTGMANNNLSFASPEDVANDIVRGISRVRPVIYTPAKWRLIMFILKHMPSALFNKLNI